MGLRENALAAWGKVIEEAEPLRIRVPEWDSDDEEGLVYVWPQTMAEMAAIQAATERNGVEAMAVTVVHRCRDEQRVPLFAEKDIPAMMGRTKRGGGMEPEVLAGICNRIRAWDVQRIADKLRARIDVEEGERAGVGES